MKLFPNSTFSTVIWNPRDAESIITQRALLHLKLVEWIQICQGFGQKLCDFCPRNGSVVVQTHANIIYLTICTWSLAQRLHLEPGRRETAHKHLMGKNKAFHVCGLQSADQKLWERMTSTQIQLHPRRKDNAGPPWVRLHFKTWEQDNITGLRYLMSWKSFW